MTEITDAEAAEVMWANSEQGKAMFRAAWAKLHAMGLHKHVDATQLGQIVYAAHLAGRELRVVRNGPSATDCIEAAMRADPSLTVEEAIRTVPVSQEMIDRLRGLDGNSGS